MKSNTPYLNPTRKAIIIALIYFSGSVCSYLYTKHNILQIREIHARAIPWTQQDRVFAITTAAGSWLNVAAMAIVDFKAHYIRYDKPAPW